MNLPIDIIIEILLYLCIRDIGRFTLISKRCSKIDIWSRIKNRDYPLFLDNIKDL